MSFEKGIRWYLSLSVCLSAFLLLLCFIFQIFHLQNNKSTCDYMCVYTQRKKVEWPMKWSILHIFSPVSYQFFLLQVLASNGVHMANGLYCGSTHGLKFSSFRASFLTYWSKTNCGLYASIALENFRLGVPYTSNFMVWTYGFQLSATKVFSPTISMCIFYCGHKTTCLHILVMISFEQEREREGKREKIHIATK